MVNGELIIKQAQEPVKIMDVEKWTNAFIIFSSVLIAKHPDHAQGLLKYMNSIRLGASRHQGLGWKAYDAQYRLRKSTKPLSDCTGGRRMLVTAITSIQDGVRRKR